MTRFDLYAVDIRDIWYEVLVIANSEAHAVLDAFAQWQETYATTDAFGTVGLSMGIQYITLGLIYSKPARTRPSAFSAFQDIQPMATAVPPTNGTVAELTSVLGSISLGSARYVRSPARPSAPCVRWQVGSFSQVLTVGESTQP